MDISGAQEQLALWADKLVKAGAPAGLKGSLSCRAGNFMVMATPETLLDVAAANKFFVADLKRELPGTHEGFPGPGALHAALYRKRSDINVLMHSFGPNTVTSSRAGVEVAPLLDDMAQMVGVSVRIADTSVDDGYKSVIRSMRFRNAVLLKGQGGLCGAGSFDDLFAVAQLLEKGCRAQIETTYLGGGFRINIVEAWLMRLVYRFKYSGKY